MKRYSYLLSGWLALGACQSPADRARNQIPGTYVNSARGPYGEARDTLLLRRLDPDHFQLHRRTTFRPIRNGKPLPWRHRQRALTLVWDPLQQELRDGTGDLVFRFTAGRGVLQVGQATYQKTN